MTAFSFVDFNSKIMFFFSSNSVPPQMNAAVLRDLMFNKDQTTFVNIIVVTYPY